MRSEWITSTIDDICKLVTDGAHNSPKSVDNGYYMASVKDFTAYGFDFSNCRKISEADYLKLKKQGCVPESGDILVGKDGARYFEDVIIYRQKEQPALLSSIAILRVDDTKVTSEFLYYTLKSPTVKKDVRDNYGSGSAIPRIVLKDFKRMPISFPSLKEQKKITNICVLLDEKIQLNNRINKNLEQQAVAVFNKFYAASTNQQPFTTLINVLGGGTPKTGNSEFWDGSIPFFTPKDVGTPYTFKTEKYITELGLKHCNSRLYPTNTTFVTARGTVGKISLAGVPMAMNQSCYALTSEIVDPLLVYFYVLKAVNALKHKASGAVFDAIVTRDFDGEIINILSDTDSEAALSIIKPMMEVIHNNSKENMRLSAARDTLLPKLMSGELDVSGIDL